MKIVARLPLRATHKLYAAADSAWMKRADELPAQHLKRTRRIRMKIAVHRFQVWDPASDDMKTSSRYATVDAIKDTAHGVAVPGTEILIEASELRSDVEGMTIKDYKPPTQLA